jgi:hypothetical protein
MTPRDHIRDVRFWAAVEAFEREHARDPRGVSALEAERLARWVERLDPDASEALCLAARSQHVRRWEIPRAQFPEGRVGYLQWRTRLMRFHADESAKILAAVGYDAATIERVRRINAKQGLRSDPDVQTMEDALCLSFLEHELEAFAAKHDDAKLIEILRKTWKKMSERGHAAALELSPNLPERARALLTRALSS